MVSVEQKVIKWEMRSCLEQRSKLRKYFIYTFTITWLVEIGAMVLGKMIPGFPAGADGAERGSWAGGSCSYSDFWRSQPGIPEGLLAQGNRCAPDWSGRLGGDCTGRSGDDGTGGGDERDIQRDTIGACAGVSTAGRPAAGTRPGGVYPFLWSDSGRIGLAGLRPTWFAAAIFTAGSQRVVGWCVGAVECSVVLCSGTYQYRLGAGTTAFWFYLLNLIPVAVVYGWLFAITGRSTLAAVLFHFMGNFVGELFALPDTAGSWLSALWLVPAIVIAICWKAGRQVETGRQRKAEILAG